MPKNYLQALYLYTCGQWWESSEEWLFSIVLVINTSESLWTFDADVTGANDHHESHLCTSNEYEGGWRLLSRITLLGHADELNLASLYLSLLGRLCLSLVLSSLLDKPRDRVNYLLTVQMLFELIWNLLFIVGNCDLDGFIELTDQRFELFWIFQFWHDLVEETLGKDAILIWKILCCKGISHTFVGPPVEMPLPEMHLLGCFNHLSFKPSVELCSSLEVNLHAVEFVSQGAGASLAQQVEGWTASDLEVNTDTHRTSEQPLVTFQ